MSSDVELRVYRLSTNRFGNACAFVFPDATLGVVDWGTKNTFQFVQLLHDVQAIRVRFIAATHSHGDHTKGLEGLLTECVQRGIPVGGFFYTANGRLKGGPYDYLGNAAYYAAKNGIPVHDVSIRNFPPGHVERPPFLDKTDDWDVRILAPASDKNNLHQLRSHLSGKNPGNATSMVLLFRYLDSNAPEGRALLPGDATPATLKFAADHVKRHPEFPIDNDTVVVPHHGSKHNWPNWVIQHLHGNAVISAGPSGLDHPSKEVLEKLAKHCARPDGSMLFCTSYARNCRETFAPKPISASDPLFGEGPCFGDIRVKLSRTGSTVIDHDSDGPRRRRCGFCTRAAAAKVP